MIHFVAVVLFNVSFNKATHEAVVASGVLDVLASAVDVASGKPVLVVWGPLF